MRQDLQQARQTVIANSLRTCQLFSGISPEELEAISSFVIPKPVAKGEYLFHAGSLASGFYVVQRGAINVHRVSSLGKEQVIHVFRAGQTFAEAAVATATQATSAIATQYIFLVIIIPLQTGQPINTFPLLTSNPVCTHGFRSRSRKL